VTVIAVDLIAVSSARPMNTVDERADPGIAYDHFGRWPQIPTEIRRLVNQSTPPWRVDSMQGYMDLVTHGPLFEYPSANGNDPFAPVRLMQVRLLFSKGELWGRYYEVTDPDSPVLKLMNVRYLISARALEHPGGLIRAAELPGTRVYENPGALPRFFLVNRIRRAGGMDAALALMRSRDFDARREAVVEGPVEFESTAVEKGTVRVVEYGARQFVLEVDTPAPAFLVTSETAYPGWHAWVDGQPRAPVTTNVAFRGLAIPAGKHVVKMRFDPEILWRAAWLTLAAGLGLALSLIWPLVSR
jgi:Bacterial membrane protein YfhO